MKGAALPIFGDAYLADTHHLSLEEHGAYFMLLLIAWRSPGCALPNDDKRIARMLGIGPAKWAKLKPVVFAFWSLENGQWTQKRLSKERAYIDKKVESNRASAKARWKKEAIEKQEKEVCERTSERNAPPPITITNVMGTDVPPANIVKTIFDMGLALLAASGHDERASRSIVGRWRKTAGDGQVLQALIDCQAKNITNPVEWVPKRLANTSIQKSEMDLLLEQSDRFARRAA